MRLTVELVPRTCWYSNVRSEVSRADWEICKQYVRERSGDKCEICGGQGRRWPVECHEIWDYNDQSHVQRLVDLIALCPACHEVKHFGRTEVVGRGRQAFEHLQKVNGWTHSETVDYLQNVNTIWEQRSRHEWTLDIGILNEILEP